MRPSPFVVRVATPEENDQILRLKDNRQVWGWQDGFIPKDDRPDEREDGLQELRRQLGTLPRKQRRSESTKSVNAKDDIDRYEREHAYGSRLSDERLEAIYSRLAQQKETDEDLKGLLLHCKYWIKVNFKNLRDNATDVEGEINHVFDKICRNARRGKSSKSIRKIINNTGKDAFRKQRAERKRRDTLGSDRRVTRGSQSDWYDGSSGDEIVEREEVWAGQVDVELPAVFLDREAIPKKDQQLAELLISGMSTEEIAEKQECSKAAVYKKKQRLGNGLKDGHAGPEWQRAAIKQNNGSKERKAKGRVKREARLLRNKAASGRNEAVYA
jgi:hypothetical protein